MKLLACILLLVSAGLFVDATLEQISRWIGKVARLTAKSVVLHEITPEATWKDFESRFFLSAISMLEFGNGYQTALAVVAEDEVYQKSLKREPRR